MSWQRSLKWKQLKIFLKRWMLSLIASCFQLYANLSSQVTKLNVTVRGFEYHNVTRQKAVQSVWYISFFILNCYYNDPIQDWRPTSVLRDSHKSSKPILILIYLCTCTLMQTPKLLSSHNSITPLIQKQRKKQWYSIHIYGIWLISSPLFSLHSVPW